MKLTRPCFFLVFITLFAAAVPYSTIAKEKEIDPSFISLKDCPDEPGCPALILMDQTELSNEKLQARLSKRQMIKVFTEEGIQKYSDVEVSAVVGGDDIRNLSGRTILPDGSIVPLKQENIFVKTAVKRGKLRVRTKTAKFAGVVPGAIIDYSYDLISPQAANYGEYQWQIQKDLPVLTSTLVVKQGEMGFATVSGGLQHVDIVRSTPFKGVTQFTATRVPAIPNEPWSPPADALRARAYLHLPELQATWLGELAGRIAGSTGDYLGDAQQVHAKVKELVPETDPPIEKVKKIYAYVQQKVGDEEQRAGQTEESQVKDPNNVDEVLKRGYGDEGDRTLLFIAMAREAGLQSALLYIVPRDGGILNTDTPDESQFDAFAAAVKTGGTTWTFYDPAVRHCPFGMISSNKEGGVPNAILITPQKGAGTVYTDTISHSLVVRYRVSAFSTAAIPFSAASRNVLQREATVTLAADGSAEVEVSDQGSGQVDLDHRMAYLGLDDEKRKEALLDRLHETLPRAQLVSADFSDIDTFEKTATIKYKITIPEVASGAADRILLTPSLFAAGRPTPFTAAKRITPVHFKHTQKTVERITYQMPPGYEAGELPKAAIVREGPFVLVTNCMVTDGKLVFSRRLEIDAATWSVEGYPQLKSFYEKVQEADRQVVVLKKGAAS